MHKEMLVMFMVHCFLVLGVLDTICLPWVPVRLDWSLGVDWRQLWVMAIVTLNSDFHIFTD